MRSLLALVVLAVAGFVLVGMFVAPSQPPLRAWYLNNACVHLDKVTPQICAPAREADSGQQRT
ncbi:hypothetical protein [Methylobacterium iners]|jgi:hypothetical protein|uniref:Uncharacterized protein n=1 Tax=Methylobacterium iners TaxID=418707 RepID=A0ABQ4S3I8_9HYPH|nr:hypothetical protein [Methylobacterium iners]GJD97180.1 hypothetical protein OCOJLMKI_4408 [Methylobacterium iners]